MPHFFINSNNISNEIITINDKETLKHLSESLRLRCGEDLKLIDENEIQYETVVFEITKKTIKAKIEKSYSSLRKLNYDIHLVQSVLKPDAQGLLISNATQCGAGKIIPILSDNCAVSKKMLIEKTQKWQKISNEAAKQCERANLAQVECIGDLSVLKEYKNNNILVFAEKYANITLQESLTDVDKTCPIAVVIGPEGGFSEREFEFFKENNYKLISLGELIFKAPNAVVAGISNIVTRL